MFRSAAKVAVAVLALLLVTYGTVNGQQGTLTPWASPSTPQAVTLIYDPSDGNLSFDVGGEQLTTLEINSEGRLFTPRNATPGGFCELNGLFETCINSKAFRIDVGGFGSMDVGPIYLASLTAEEVVADIDMSGSFLGTGGLDRFVPTSPHLYVVPEPSGITLLTLGMLSFCRRRRDRLAN